MTKDPQYPIFSERIWLRRALELVGAKRQPPPRPWWRFLWFDFNFWPVCRMRLGPDFPRLKYILGVYFLPRVPAPVFFTLWRYRLEIAWDIRRAPKEIADKAKKPESEKV